MFVNDFTLESCATVGTGSYALGVAARTGAYRKWNEKVTTGKQVFFVARTTQASPNGAKYEYGYGVFTTGSPDTLARTVILGSSNSGAAVSWLATDVYLVFSAPPLDLIDALLFPIFVDNAAANLTITVAHWGQTIDFDVTAANRTCTLPAGATMPKGFRLRVYGYGSTVNSVVLTPNGTEKFNEGSAGATLNVVGGGMKTVEWDDTKAAWRVY